MQAYKLYASLHGWPCSAQDVEPRIKAYLDDNQPDEVVDDAVLAFLEDRILAPPDVILECWGSSRFYELSYDAERVGYHQVCETWFENDCRLPSNERSPRMAHFWTTLHFPCDEKHRELRPGMRVQFELGTDCQVNVLHRELGRLGVLPCEMAESIHGPGMRDRKFLGMLDLNFDPSASEHATLLVITSSQDVPVAEIVEYAQDAFLASRVKC